MPSRLNKFNVYPWTGGLVTSVDESLLQPGQLTQADNVLFSTQGTRLKRKGINADWDDLSISSVNRSSDGLNRTLTTVGISWKLGDTIRVSGGPSAYNTTAGVISSISSTNTSIVTISNGSPAVVAWTAHGLSDGDPIVFSSTGELPAPLVQEQVYFVINSTTDDFQLTSTPGGTVINTTLAGTGTHTAREALENVITYTFSGAPSLTESETADTSMAITLNTKIIALYDYWYGSTSAKTQRLIAFTSSGSLIEINTATGARSTILDAGSPYLVPVGGLQKASIIAFENRLMVAVSGQNNVLKHYLPTILGGSGVLENVVNTENFADTPQPDFLQVHVGRLFCNDKNNPDRLHYSQTGVYNIWQGAGDSGAIDIGVGDGDPQGLTAIFPPFKGVLFVAKRTKLYKMSGQFPETFYPERAASSLGCISHQAVAAIDQDDVIFVSDKGVHSAAATDTYGDFAQTYVSQDIQGSINETWNRARQTFIQASYLPQINSIGFTVAEESDSTQQDLWLYNFALKQWYRWPNINCSAICFSNDIDKQRFYFGRDDGRVAQSFTENNFDVDTLGDEKAVIMSLASGFLAPDGDISTIKAYKRFVLIYKPTGSYTISVSFKIDNFSAQPLVYNDNGAQDLLGTSFVLGQSVLGVSLVAAPFMQSIDGYGRGFKINIQQSGLNEFGEILGFMVFYESTEPVYETRTGDSE